MCAPISVERFEHQPEGGQTLTEAIVEVLGESTPFVLLGDDEPAEQPRSGCFGLRPISDLRGQQGPRFRQLAARLCRRRRVGGGVLCQARVGGKRCHRQMRRDTVPEHFRRVSKRENGRSDVSGAAVLMVHPPCGSHRTLPLGFLQISRADAGVRSTRTEQG